VLDPANHLSVIAVSLHAGPLNSDVRDTDLLIRPFSDKFFSFSSVFLIHLALNFVILMMQVNNMPFCTANDHPFFDDVKSR
jgi:hypothetical protein